MPRIVVTDATFPTLDHERAVAARYGTTLEEARCKSEADVISVAEGTNVLIVQFAKVTGAAIGKHGACHNSRKPRRKTNNGNSW